MLDRIPQLYKEAALVSYGIELSDLHVELILSGKMKYRDVIRELLCEPRVVRAVH